ncbi:hypothetical protein L9F63_017277 [Diploptera punctata]|uniref:Uncharacterized protein n=1 Tax=Diploptera punctata TaxID=6984 RepID=A0AAD8EGJ2_DIPPU|nr:hypothetical protein L9F63_017277 [Diploptera punctata]
MNTLVVCLALAAVSVVALSPNHQPDLKSRLTNLNYLDANVLGPQITKSNIEDGQFLLAPFVRTTREAENHIMDSCCDVERLKLDHMKEYIKECKGSRTENQRIFICIGEEAGVCDAEGKIIDLEKFAEMMAKMYENEELKPNVKETAMKMARYSNSHHGQVIDGHKQIAIYQAFYLTKTAVDLDCPKEMRINSWKEEEMKKETAEKWRDPQKKLHPNTFCKTNQFNWKNRRIGSDDDGKIIDTDKFGDMMANMYADDKLKPKIKHIAMKCAEYANNYHGQETDGVERVAVLEAFFLTKLLIDKHCPDRLKISSKYSSIRIPNFNFASIDNDNILFVNTNYTGFTE